VIIKSVSFEPYYIHIIIKTTSQKNMEAARSCLLYPKANTDFLGVHIHCAVKPV